MALSPKHARWAVGVGTHWKHRENAARLALSVAFVDQATPEFATNWSDFANFAAEGALDADSLDDAMQLDGKVKVEAANMAPVPISTSKTRKRKKDEANDERMPVTDATFIAPFPQVPVGADGGLPRDTPLWVRLIPDLPRPRCLASLTPKEGIVVCTDGKRKGLYSNGDAALSTLVGNVQGDVEYHDDFNWANYPELGKALKQLAPRDSACALRLLSLWMSGVWA